MGEVSAVRSFCDYMAAFTAIGPLTDLQLKMLQIHYHARDHTITATQMAHALGYSHYAFANCHYVTLAKHMGLQLNFHPSSVYVGALVTFDKRRGEWHWILRPEVAQALEALGWAGTDRRPVKES